MNGEYAGVALCALRHDYVEGCETSPVGYLEGVCVQEEYRQQGVARKLVSDVSNGHEKKDASNLPVTVS